MIKMFIMGKTGSPSFDQGMNTGTFPWLLTEANVFPGLKPFVVNDGSKDPAGGSMAEQPYIRVLICNPVMVSSSPTMTARSSNPGAH